MARQFAYKMNENARFALACSVGVGAFLAGRAAFLFAPEHTLSTSRQLLAELAFATALAVLSFVIWRMPILSKFLREDDTDAGKGGRVSVAPSEMREPALLESFTRRLPDGLPSKEYLLAQIDKSIEASCDRTVLAVFEIKDFDRMYAFDLEMAQETLVAFAKRMRDVFGGKHTVSHLDRGQFGIWFGGMDETDAQSKLNSTSYALNSEIEIGDGALIPDVQLRIGIYPDDGATAETLVTKTLISGRFPGAEQAASRTPSGEARDRYLFEQDLRHAVERRELALHYQPIVDLNCGRVVAAEALIRWHHPVFGQISPGVFVPILEEMGLINEIGMWSLNAACAAQRRWQDKGLKDLTVAINLSAQQLQDPALVLAVDRALRKHKVAANSLTLELTETAAMQDSDRTLALFAELKSIGVELAIDDFGTGYSSLSYLLRLPFDKLKIDREFVTNVQCNVDRRATCRSLVELADGLRISLIAEGAETPDEVEALQSLGCRFVQGFYFSLPLPEEEFCQLVRQQLWPARLVHSLVSSAA